ncbi:peroxiredoxin [Xanthomonadaceae bacterium XH05]|nr:peroxiredoxin [Xanthomonadaceae bacterium XH05]
MIAIGNTLPNLPLSTPRDGSPTPIDSREVFAGKRVVLTAVPGAFTPTCSARHLPGYIERIQDFRARGIDVAFISVNDAFVLDAWGKSQNAPDDILMLADGNAEFTRALGLEMDASAYGMGVRSRRYALYAEDGVVKALFVEAPGEFSASSADAVLAALAE